MPAVLFEKDGKIAGISGARWKSYEGRNSGVVNFHFFWRAVTDTWLQTLPPSQR